MCALKNESTKVLEFLNSVYSTDSSEVYLFYYMFYLILQRSNCMLHGSFCRDLLSFGIAPLLGVHTIPAPKLGLNSWNPYIPRQAENHLSLKKEKLYKHIHWSIWRYLATEWFFTIILGDSLSLSKWLTLYIRKTFYVYFLLQSSHNHI